MATILAVDDDADIRLIFQVTLEMAGHDVVTAESGTAAIALLRERPFDVVILDIMMPGVDGFDVLKSLSEMPERCHTPVIIVTAKHDPDGVAKELAAGAADHIAKPFSPTELHAVVERVLAADVQQLAERRRALGNGATVYGSLHDLFDVVHAEG